jgi:hypothetical protein
MSDQENRNPQHSDPQKPGPQKSGNLPNQSAETKSQFPIRQSKSPQPDPEKHDQEKKQNA